MNYFRDEAYRLQTDQRAVVPARTSSTPAKSNVSPYLQKLPHSNFIQTMLPPTTSSSAQQQQRRQRRRRRSTSVARTRGELIDSAYQPSNVDHLDLSSFFANSNHSFHRPTSAPTRTYVLYKIYINKQIINISFSSINFSPKKKRRRLPLHKSRSKGHAFLITIYRNGDHDKSCYCKASSLNAVNFFYILIYFFIKYQNRFYNMQLKNFICHLLLVVYLMDMDKKYIVVKIYNQIKNIMFQVEKILKIHTNQFKVNKKKYIYLKY